MGQKQSTEKSENNYCDNEENKNSEQEENIYIDAKKFYTLWKMSSNIYI